jgi:hypothetical protein
LPGNRILNTISLYLLIIDFLRQKFINMRNNIRILGFLLSFCLWLNFTNIYAQLEVTQESDAEKLAKAFVGIGLEVSNATLTCPEGGSGFF